MGCGPHNTARSKAAGVDGDDQGPIAQCVALAHLLAARLAKADRLHGVAGIGRRLGSLLGHRDQPELGLDDDGHGT